MIEEISNFEGPEENTNFAGPPIPPKITPRRLLGLVNIPSTPEFENRRHLSEIYKNPNTVTDYNFFEKIGVAARTETSTAEFFSDLFSPRFRDEDGFTITPELEHIMSDLPQETQEKIVETSSSTREFLHEVDDARKMLKLREELFAGGVLGAFGGFAATMLMAGSEAAAVTGLAAGLGLFGGGPVGSVTASAATAAARVKRIKKTLDTVKLGVLASQRSRAVGKAALATAAVDVPIELVRYANDTTITETDFWFALGASATLGGGIAAWKPGLFAAPINAQARKKFREEAADVAEAMGDARSATALRADKDNISFVDPTLAEEIKLTRRSAAAYRQSAKEAEAAGEADRAAFLRKQAEAEGVQIKNLEAQSVPVEKLTKSQFDSEIERLGIATRRNKNGDWIDARGKRIAKKNLESKLKEQREAALRTKMVETQITRTVSNIEGKQALRKLFERYKINLPKGVRDNVDAMRSALIKGVVSASREGGIKTPRSIEVPESLQVFTQGTISGNKTQVNFDSDLDRLLYEAGREGDWDGKESLIDLLEEYGVQGPRQLAEEMRQGVDAEIASGRFAGKTIGVNHEDFLDIPSQVKVDLEPLDLEFDDDLLFSFGAGFTKSDEHVMGGREVVYMNNDGQDVGRGPEVPGVREMNVDDYAEYANRTYEEGGATVKNAKGILGKTSRFLGGTGERLLPSFVGKVFHLLNRQLTPMGAILQGYDSRIVQGFANIMIATPKGGGVNVHTQLREIYEFEVGEFMQSMVASANAYKKATGSRMTPDQHRQIFRRITQKDGGPMEEWERLGVEAHRKFTANMKKYAKDNGIDVNDLPNPETYVKRIWNTTKFHDFETEVMENFFTKAVIAGLKKNNKEVRDPEKFARAAAKRIIEFGQDPSSYRNRAKGVQWETTTQKSLLDEGYTEEEVNDIISIIVDSTSIKKEPHQTFAKRRIDLDENYEEMIDGEMIHIDYFLNRNMDDLVGGYAHTVIGAVETRKGFEALGKSLGPNSGISADTSFETILQKAKADIQKRYKGKESQERIDERKKFVEFSFERIYTVATGQRMYDVPDWAMKTAIGLQAFASATIGNMLGVAQLPEVMGVMCRSGLKAAMQGMPALKEISSTFMLTAFKEKGVRSADGRMADKMSAMYESMFSVGRDYQMREHFTRRMDDLGYDKSLRLGKMGRVLEAGRMVGMLNPLGIMPMDTFLRRWGARSHFQSFVNQAYDIKNGKGVVNDNWWRKSRTRFQQLGLSDDQIDRITKELGRDGVLEVKEGLFGGYKVLDINIDKVEDMKAYDLMVTSIRRAVDSTIQRQSMGELPAWMSSGGGLGLMGKLWSQYRVFSIAARGKQLAAGIDRMDGTEAIQWVGSAGLGYVGLQIMLYKRSLTMNEQDAREMWESNSGFATAAMSGFMRSNISSVGPMLWDSLAQLLPGDLPTFNKYARTTGLGIDPWSGSVPGSMINRGFEALGLMGDVAGAALGVEGSYESLTTKRFQNAQGIAPFVNTPILKQAIDYSVYGAPQPD